MIRFAIFSDYHYWKGHYPQNLDGLAAIVDRAKAENCDFIINCGDTCHNVPTAPELDSVYVRNRYGIPAYSCIGNHEVEAADVFADVLTGLNMPSNYYFFDRGGYRFIVLDSNYYWKDGELFHNPPRSHSMPNGDRIPAEQLQWLDRTVSDSDGYCVLFSHTSLELTATCADSPQIMKILAKYPHKVILACSGHYHTGGIRVHDGTAWLSVPATYNAFWAMMDNPLYTDEFKKTARMTKNCCFSTDPLSAIITLDDGTVTVKGMKSTWLYDVSPEKLGRNTPDSLGYCPTVEIPDFCMKF